MQSSDYIVIKTIVVPTSLYSAWRDGDFLRADVWKSGDRSAGVSREVWSPHGMLLVGMVTGMEGGWVSCTLSLHSLGSGPTPTKSVLGMNINMF